MKLKLIDEDWITNWIAALKKEMIPSDTIIKREIEDLELIKSRLQSPTVVVSEAFKAGYNYAVYISRFFKVFKGAGENTKKLSLLEYLNKNGYE